MPEQPERKHHDHPLRRPSVRRGRRHEGSPDPGRVSGVGRDRRDGSRRDGGPGLERAHRGRARPAARYAELEVATNFTFLTGASHPEELVREAARLGHEAAAVADRNTLAGVVRAHLAAREAGIPLAVGCRLAFERPEGLELLAFPTDRASYGRLSQLLTRGKRRATKGECRLFLDDFLEHEEGMLAVFLPPRALEREPIDALLRLRGALGERLSIAVTPLFRSFERERTAEVVALARDTGIPLVATGGVHYHERERRALQDVLTCIRHGCSLSEAGWRLHPNAERHLRPASEVRGLLPGLDEALERAVEIARRAAGFSLDELDYRYPHEICPDGRGPMEHLVHLTWEGARERYPHGIPGEVAAQVRREFTLIGELAYAPYFLTVHDIVRYARSRGILCQGRGAAANSAVCFCLGVTSVDPARIDILFERFVSRERNEPPDIDVDFEHERREEVIQYIYGKYGRDRAALTAEVITYRGRSAVREVGKALGLSLDAIDRLAKNMDWWEAGEIRPHRLRELGLRPSDPTLRRMVKLTAELLGFPRHLSQHVGGFVITERPLSELVPIENAAMEDRTVIEWDKDDIDAMGMLKVDILGLGMLTCVRKSFEMIASVHGRRHDLATVPAEDPAVYDMICEADTVGVFQIESRAQMTMLPRLRPRCFYDLVIEVAIVRPGPIQGDMVHPYLRRRNGEEPVSFPDDKVKKVLAKTLGVPLFQEQAMALAVVAAGFTPGEADRLRRAMAAWRRHEKTMQQFGERLLGGMTERGYDRDFAERCFRQIQGFSEYGFPESHAASFALIVYVSAWIKRHYPAVFAAALVNSQPMGFYAPAQILRDAREHGVEIRPVDVNASAWDCTLEEDGRAVRIGMRQVKGLGEDDAEAIAAAVRERGPFRTIEDLRRESGVRVFALRKLARADAFRSMRLTRQQALWELRALCDDPVPIFDRAAGERLRQPPEADGGSPARNAELPEIAEPRQVVEDYASVGVSLRAHPISFLRDRLAKSGVVPAAWLLDDRRFPRGKWAAVAGVVLVRQRPSTAKGILFMTLEDETAVANLMVHPTVYEKYRRPARAGVIVVARGRIERQGRVVHVRVRSMEDWSDRFPGLSRRSRDFH